MNDLSLLILTNFIIQRGFLWDNTYKVKIEIPTIRYHSKTRDLDDIKTREHLCVNNNKILLKYISFKFDTN